MPKGPDSESFLEEDAAIPGQKFCLLSFLSPENVLKDKALFMFEKFLKSYEFQSRTKNLEAFLMKTANEFNEKLDTEADKFEAADLSGAAVICRAAKLRVDMLMDDFQNFVKKNEKELKETQIKEAFDDFMYVNKTKLEDEFFVKNDFCTTVRGLKVRGVYGSQEEAVARSKRLQRLDPLHNIYVGEIGKWLPWDPAPNDVAEQEYAEDQLNTLMKKYKENEEEREAFQREQRARATGKGSKAAAPGITVLSNEEAGPAAVDAPDAAGSASSMSNIFDNDGPADLAIARKMNKDRDL